MSAEIPGQLTKSEQAMADAYAELQSQLTAAHARIAKLEGERDELTDSLALATDLKETWANEAGRLRDGVKALAGEMQRRAAEPWIAGDDPVFVYRAVANQLTALLGEKGE